MKITQFILQLNILKIINHKHAHIFCLIFVNIIRLIESIIIQYKNNRFLYIKIIIAYYIYL